MTVIVLPVVLMFPCLAAAYHCALAVSSAAGNMPVIAFPFVPVFSILVAASHSTLPVGDAAPTIIFVVVSVLTCLMTARHSTGKHMFSAPYYDDRFRDVRAPVLSLPMAGS